MCTLIVAFHLFEGFPIVVAANRDELLDRSSEKPQIHHRGHLVLSPIDLVRGGTWIGVNEYGVLAALTNRLDIKSESGRMSRGMIVADALKYQAASQAFFNIGKLNGGKLNGFNMIIADQSAMFLLRGDGNSIKHFVERSGLLVVTNHGVGRETDPYVPRRVENIFSMWESEKIVGCKPSPESLSALLNIHDEERHGTCINEPDNNYGTKSSSIIRLKTVADSNEWHYWHRERTSPGNHICDDLFDQMIKLPIRNL